MAIEAAAFLAGGCQCGAVRYRLAAEPTGVNVCHCRMCQKASGAPFMAFGGVRMSEFIVTHGAISTFMSSDIAERLLRAMRDASEIPGPRQRPGQRDARQSRRSKRGGADDAAWRRIKSALASALVERSGDAHRAMAGAEEDRRGPESPAPGS
jgi:hypothetical protein